MKRMVTVLLRKNSGMQSPFMYVEVLIKTLDELGYGNISPFFVKDSRKMVKFL